MIFRFTSALVLFFVLLALLGIGAQQSQAKSRDSAKFSSSTASSDDVSAVQKKRKKKKRKPGDATEVNGEEKKRKKAKAKALASDKLAAAAVSMPSIISDAQLAQIYRMISQGQSRQALGTIESLLKQAPNYRLLQLLHADLLTILSQRASKPAALVNTSKTLSGNTLNATAQERLEQLQQEAWLRLNSHANTVKAQNPKLIPKPFILLSPDEPYAMVVDSRLSRLYVYQNVPNAPPKLLSDHYVTQGKLGVFKTVEGDKRTPIGTYFFTGPINQALPDLYGYGALGMDYPNAWDKLKGRTGHGIWMHGVPSSTYARAPYASDGCIAISNPDMATMFALKTSGSMPIVVADKLEFVDAQSVVADRNYIASAITQWGSAQSADVQKLTALEYPGEAGLVLTRFEMVDRNTKRSKKKELYLKKDAGQWKIAIDNNL